ncbi:hypothetical protein HHI36_012963 [Cryptolaemus montrouzieri]|uniref:Transcription factor Adf-1 n=1 Tax=Cryptolaemus montrouzieri TaxID=559131 RepID=A0ABD2NGU0_9CUCU
MGDEKLIDLIQKYDVIYNIKCIEYRDARLRNAAWEQIAKLHGKSVEECKENWNKLRNCYNNAMKRRRKKSDQTGKIIGPWRFEEQMSFLKPYLGDRQAAGNDVSISNASFSDPSTASPMYPERTSRTISSTSYRRKASSSTENDYMEDMKKLMKTSQEINTRREELDDLDTFFLSMSKSIKKLPKVDQIRIKMDLLKAISEAELGKEKSQ